MRVRNWLGKERNKSEKIIFFKFPIFPFFLLKTLVASKTPTAFVFFFVLSMSRKRKKMKNELLREIIDAGIKKIKMFLCVEKKGLGRGGRESP